LSDIPTDHRSPTTTLGTRMVGSRYNLLLIHINIQHRFIMLVEFHHKHFKDSTLSWHMRQTSKQRICSRSSDGLRFLILTSKVLWTTYKNIFRGNSQAANEKK
uniref:Ovule protein n=1 Tax=Parascaris univalens TaxID=6257 RepID=A0A914ZL24_PARUN